MPSKSMYDVTAEIQIAIDPRSKIEDDLFDIIDRRHQKTTTVI